MSSRLTDSCITHFDRKFIPVGSDHFQKVLDEILKVEEIDKSADQIRDQKGQKVTREQSHVGSPTTLDTNQLCTLSTDSESLAIIGTTKEQSIDNNNNTLTNNCRSECCQSPTYSTCENGTSKIVSEKILKHQHYDQSLTQSCQEGTAYTYRSKAREISRPMGTNCSSNFYDHRQWHNIPGDSPGITSKPKKRGRLLKKRIGSESSDRNPELATACTCLSGNTGPDLAPANRPLDLQTNGLKPATNKRAASLCPGVVINGPQVTSSRLSPNVDNSGHIMISLGVRSGRARASAECDVSPHRFLNRRPNSTDPSSTSDNQDMRSRSRSWSAGKLTARYNSAATPSSSPSQPLLSKSTIEISVHNETDTISNQLSAVTNSINKPPLTYPEGEVHNPECPCHHKVSDDVPHISITKPQVTVPEDADPDLAPISRRRAASESQTMRPRRLLPRTPDSCDHIQEHVHVRWADEKKGSSLSTSVCLSTIRPRSYSYGAGDCTPHRPILKKVA